MGPTVVSIYSGGGGLDLGFHKAGFHIEFATDHWRQATVTLKHVGHAAHVMCADIREIDFKEVRKNAPNGRVDCLVGGPPCPAYSKSRFYRTEKERGMDDKSSGFTLSEFFRAVEELKPAVFLFENVHGFVYKPHRKSFEFLETRSKELGYQISWRVINCADYGVPQTRERFICVGTRLEMARFVFPAPTHAKDAVTTGLKNWVTCKEAIGDLDVPRAKDADMQAGSKHKELLRLIPPGDNYLFFTKERGYKKPIFKWRSRYWSFLLKLSPDRPSWTIQASHSNNMGPFHWNNRFLRISEIKRIQTFDDDYEILGNFREQWRQIGNAVPPKLAEILAHEIKTQFFTSPVTKKQEVEPSTHWQ